MFFFLFLPLQRWTGTWELARAGRTEGAHHISSLFVLHVLSAARCVWAAWRRWVSLLGPVPSFVNTQVTMERAFTQAVPRPSDGRAPADPVPQQPRKAVFIGVPRPRPHADFESVFAASATRQEAPEGTWGCAAPRCAGARESPGKQTCLTKRRAHREGRPGSTSRGRGRGSAHGGSHAASAQEKAALRGVLGADSHAGAQPATAPCPESGPCHQRGDVA